MKFKLILLLIFSFTACSDFQSPDRAEIEDGTQNFDIGSVPSPDSGDLVENIEQIDIGPSNNEEVQEEPEIKSEEMGIDNLPGLPSYPDGPYSLELFKVIPDMQFYNPWLNEWVALSNFYKHEKNKALIVVSSAGWCGPCLSEAAALIEIYENYHFDGLEIIYTLGNTNIPGDVPFDFEEDYLKDMEFMENWRFMTQDEAGKVLNYQMYADPKREFIKYLPSHAWPLSMLITTKDMGIRLIEEGFWGALVENKIMLVLYNDVPVIPFK